MIRPFVAGVQALTRTVQGVGQNIEGWLGTARDREGDRRDDHDRSLCISGVKMTRKCTGSYGEEETYPRASVPFRRRLYGIALFRVAMNVKGGRRGVE